MSDVADPVRKKPTQAEVDLIKRLAAAPKGVVPAEGK